MLRMCLRWDKMLRLWECKKHDCGTLKRVKKGLEMVGMGEAACMCVCVRERERKVSSGF